MKYTLTLRCTLTFATAICIALVSCHAAFGIYHTVHKGDTLSDIAYTYSVPTKDLQQVNFLRNPNNLNPGQQIFIPGADRVRRVMKRPTGTEKSLGGGINASRGSSSRKVSHGSSMAGVPKKKISLIWPVEGVLTSGFGMRSGKMHNGIDISAKEGTSIMSAAAGTVIYSDNKQRGFGNLVVIKHESGFFTVYGHNKMNLVQKGDKVRKGQVIARLGNTGRSTGPHLHFEVRHHKKALDPLELLP